MPPAALRLIAPEVMLVRLVVEARLMSRPDVTLMAGAVSASPMLVACRLPFRLMSFKPVVTSRMVPLLANAPRLRLPRLRVRLILPLGLKVPPVWLKSVPTVMVPDPPSEPDDRLTMGAASAPLTVSPPPAIPSVVPAFMLKAPDTVSAPPVKLKFSSESIDNTGRPPAVMVMVCKPATLMRTRCPVVGAKPVLQFAPTDQSPLVPIQQSSTAQLLGMLNVTPLGP